MVGKLECAAVRHDTLCVVKKCHNLFTLSTNSDITTVNININENTPYIFLLISCAKESAKFLIDTAASVSFISSRLTKNGTRVNKKNIVNIKSATGHSATTIATLIGIINLNNYEISHEFHIFGRDLQIAVDGIIGFDFLYKHNWIIFPNLHKILYDPKLINILQRTIFDYEEKMQNEKNEYASNDTDDDELITSTHLHERKKFNFPHKQFELKNICTLNSYWSIASVTEFVGQSHT